MTRQVMNAMAWIGILTGPAAAGDFSFSFGLLTSNQHGNRVTLGIEVNRPELRPAPVIHIPATYATVSERIWVPTTETVYRDLPVLDGCGNTIAYRREAQVVQSGYWETVQRQVLVRPASTVVLGAGGQPRHGMTARAHSRPLQIARTFTRAVSY